MRGRSDAAAEHHAAHFGEAAERVKPIAADEYARWVEANPYPDVLALVRAYGAWSDIPHEAWANYDKRVRDWKARRIDRLMRL